ncbi:GNAT family N-acetyltransferase [Chitinophaga flava]|nr:GNAT family N-acetyltransferase [Chitinophaga flava]
MLQFESGIYHIRQLLPAEAPLYKTMRLEALLQEAGMFRSKYPPEVALTDEQWQEQITDADKAVFGLFAGDEMIGITRIILRGEQGEEGYLGQSYIRKAYRGKGLSDLLYKIRMAWAAEHRLKRVWVSHRESNVASRAANQRFGFVYSHRESCHWQDGQTEDVLYYVLEL